MPNGKSKSHGPDSKPTGNSLKGTPPGREGGGTAVKAELKQLRKQVAGMRAQRGDGSNVAHRVLYEQFKAALGAITDPFNTEPQRFSFAGGRPTAVNKLFRIESSGSASASSSGTILAANCGFAAVRRDPRCATIRYVVQSGSSTYRLQFSTGGGLQAGAPGPGPGGWFEPVRADFTSGTWQRHGKQMVPWQDAEGINRFWLDVEPQGSSTANIVISGLAATTDYTFVFSRELLGVATDYTVTDTTDADGLFTYNCPVSQSGRWAVQSDQDLTDLAVAIEFQTSCPCSFSHKMLPRLEEQLGDIDATRVNALSILYSDRTAELNSQGSIVTYQASGGDDWAEHAGLTKLIGTNVNNYGKVAEYNTAKNGPYKKGRYNFCKLSGIEDLRMIDIGEGTGLDRYMPPINYMDDEDDRDYLIMLFDSSNATSLNGQWTFCWHIESETESQWRDVESPVMHPDVFKDAQWVSAQADQDYENPKHLKKIWDFVKKGAGYLSTVGAALTPILPPQFQGPAMVGSRIAGMISKL